MFILSAWLNIVFGLIREFSNNNADKQCVRANNLTK